MTSKISKYPFTVNAEFRILWWGEGWEVDFSMEVKEILNGRKLNIKN
jgi:hypothetical protein